MKKHLTLALLAAGAFVGGAAQAADSVTIPLEGTLPKVCNVSAYLNGPFNALAMDSTAVQGAESLTANCNYGGSLSVKFESANAGVMKNETTGDTVPYSFILSGSPFSTGVSLATAQTWSGFPAVVNSDQTRGMSVKLDAAATVAGTYKDTITASVAPN